MEPKGRLLLFGRDTDAERHMDRLLAEQGYSITYLETGAAEHFSGEEGPLDLVLCRISSDDPDEDILAELSLVREKTSAPVVIATSINRGDFFLKAISEGYCGFVVMPCSESFFLSVIEDTIRRQRPGSGGDAMAVTVSHRDSTRTLSLTGDGFSKTMESLLDNMVHKSMILRDILDREHTLKNLCSVDELFEDFDSCSVKGNEFEEEMYRGVTNNEFVMFYHPVVSLRDMKVSGFETLIRWNHPEKGFLLPDMFIQQAENSPVILPLGFWIVEEVTKQLNIWKEKLSLFDSLRLNINLSARQFVNERLSDRILEIMDEKSIDPENIGFEITESAFMENMEVANMTLLKLKARDFLLYMDDFGTGYSSLSYLQHFPVDVLKIDKSFVQWMHIDEHSEAIVRSLIALSHNLGMKVVAEGVQEEEHVVMLRNLECDFIQGYYISKPMDSEETLHFMKNGNGDFKGTNG